MSDFDKVVKGLENKIERDEATPQKPSKDNYVIFKEGDAFKGTPRSNFDAKVRDASKVQDYPDFKTHDQVRDYLIKYGKGKTADDFEYEGLETKTDLKPKQSQKDIDAKYKPLYEEMDKEDDELYRRYYYETDPKKKKQLKAERDEHGKKIDSLIEEWEQAGKTKPVKSGSFEEAAGKIAKNDKEIGDFNPTEPLFDFDSGAKTHSENEFRIEALNDRSMYDYITKNRDYLYKKAHADPEGAVKDIIRHGSKDFGIDPKNIRKDFAVDVLGGFYEDDGGAPDLSKPEEFKPTEPIEAYDDSYGAKTRSERNLNVLTANDQGAYDYIVANRDELAKEAEYDPDSVLNKIRWHFQTPGYYKEIKPGNVRKEYLIEVIKNIIED